MTTYETLNVFQSRNSKGHHLPCQPNEVTVTNDLLTYVFVDEPSCGVIPSTFSSSLHVKIKVLFFRFGGKFVRHFYVFSVRFGSWSRTPGSESKKLIGFSVLFNNDGPFAFPEFQFTYKSRQLASQKADVGRLVHVLLHHEGQVGGLRTFCVVDATPIRNATVGVHHQKEIFQDAFDGVCHIVVK